MKRIQKELQALDDMVSNDIGILRGKIEQASWEYSAARYRNNTRTCGNMWACQIVAEVPFEF